MEQWTKLPQKIQNYYLLVISSQITQVPGSVPMNEKMPEMPLATESSLQILASLLKWGSDSPKLLWFQKYFKFNALQIQLEFPCTTFSPVRSLGNTKTDGSELGWRMDYSGEQLQAAMTRTKWTQWTPLCLRSTCKTAHTCDPCQCLPLDSCQLSNSNCLPEFLALVMEG